MKRILNRKDVQNFLNEILVDARFINKPFKNAPNGESFAYNQYSLLIVMDALIKYKIIVNDETLLYDYITQIRRIMKKVEDHNDIIHGISTILGKVVAVKLGIEDISSSENKRKILEYIYQKYIVNGYFFKGILNKTLDSQMYASFQVDDVNKILINHGLNEMILEKENLFEDYITATDSAMMAYYDALSYPSYLSSFCSINPYMQDEKKYDKGAYYRKDYEACRKNILRLGKEYSFTEDELKVVICFFDNEWKRIKDYFDDLNIAFIKRDVIGKNFLEDYEQILESSNEYELAYSISKITKSCFRNERINYNFSLSSVLIESFPTYQDFNIDNNIPSTNMENSNIDFGNCLFSTKFINAYGNVSIVALIGMLFVTIGAMVTILLGIYGG